MRGRLIVSVLLPLVAAACSEQKIAQGQVRSALVDAGLSPPISQCMAHRMVDQLTIKQLRKLKALKGMQGPQGTRRPIADYILAVQQIDDPQVVRVTISSAALCATGLEH